MNLARTSARSYEVVTLRDLERLNRLVSKAHRELRTIRPDLAGRLVAGCLAQGAAAHLVDGSTGVKDFDLWLFYRRDEGSAPANARRRATYDFGHSVHGRHPGDDPNRFRGRRVDVMCRSLPIGSPSEPEAAVRLWLSQKADSPRTLSQRPVVILWPRPSLGRIVSATE